MKLKIKPAVILNTFILGAVLLQVGCATTGNQRSADTRTTLKSVEMDYRQTREQVDVMKVLLESIVDPNQTNEKKAFEKYSDEVNKTGNLERRLAGHADKMRVQQRNYFEEWRMQGNTYENPEIQALSEQRRADLTAVFANVAEASVGVKGAFKAYMSDLRQIRTYLSTDLTPKGIGSIDPVVQQAVTDGENLNEKIRSILSALDTARDELAQGDSK